MQCKREINPELEPILREMCRRVGADYDSIDFVDSSWYLGHAWTEEEANEFIKWLGEYFYQNTRARQALFRIPRKTKKRCMDAAKEFEFRYGWKIKDVK